MDSSAIGDGKAPAKRFASFQSLFSAFKRSNFSGFHAPYSNLNFTHLRSQYLFKILLIGDNAVGKSSLLLRFTVRSLPPSSFLHPHTSHDLLHPRDTFPNTPILTANRLSPNGYLYFIFVPVQENTFTDTLISSIGGDFVRLA